jgi:FkbH-like protein
MTNKTFQSLKKNLKKDFSTRKTIKMAVLGDSATQMYVQALRGYGYEAGYNFDVFEADYNQVELQVYDPESELYRFAPEYTLIIFCVNKLFNKFGTLPASEKTGFATGQIEHYQSLFKTIEKNMTTQIIFANFNEVNDGVFGNYANKTNSSFLYQTRKINYELMNLAQKAKNLFILDLNALQSHYGADFVMDNKIYVTTELFFKLDFLPVLAHHTVDIIQAIEGKFKKCLILDLDNTLWGGVIGDDGIENIQIGSLGIGKAYTEIQIWAKQLKQRGIILAVCSKNDEKNAKEPFEKHPEMVLKLEDISLFVANWENKADNIRYIQKVLNIGFDSMVFLDDNPFERNMVKTHIQDITVPELPEDPAEYLPYLRTLNLFETASYTEEDEKRTDKYRVEAKRVAAYEHYTNETDFLKSLNMVSKVEGFNGFNTPRVAQLTQRSNQFNLRTVRYTEQEIEKMAKDDNYVNLAFSLKDKYGEYGLISVVILRKLKKETLFIDTWIMSCRVLKRDMEKFVLNTLVEAAQAQNYRFIQGEFLPTAKNGMVKDHYKNLGFVKENGLWSLNVEKYEPHPCFINRSTA